MAQLLHEYEDGTCTMNTQNEEKSYTFIFDDWIKKNKFEDIKQVFTDYNITTIDTLDINNNANFLKMLSDSRIMLKPQLVITIIGAVQSLEPLKRKIKSQSNESTSKKLVFLTKNENNVFTQISEYINNMDKLHNECKNITTNFENKKAENIQQIKDQNKTLIERLECIDNEIKLSFNKLHNLLNNKENKLHEEINQYKTQINNFINKNNKIINNINEQFKQYKIDIKTNKNYYTQQIANCKTIVNKLTDNNNDISAFKAKNHKRELQIVELGNKIAEYYEKQIIEMNKNKNEIIKFMQHKVISENDIQKYTYQININDETYNDIVDDIDSYVTISKMNDIKAENNDNMSKAQLLSQLCEMKSNECITFNEIKYVFDWIRIGDIAPNFDAKSTFGKINFYKYIGNNWCVLFSHPADFTPVCTTELGMVEKLQNEFNKRNVKTIGLSCDSVYEHYKWIKDIIQTQNIKNNNKFKLSFPIIDDKNRIISSLYGMLDKTNINNKGLPLTVRSVYIIDANKKIQLILTYPASTGRNFDEIIRCIDSLQLTAKYKVATPVNWNYGDDVVVVPSISTNHARQIFKNNINEIKPYLRITPQPIHLIL